MSTRATSSNSHSDEFFLLQQTLANIRILSCRMYGGVRRKVGLDNIPISTETNAPYSHLSSAALAAGTKHSVVPLLA